jgi:2-oxoacid:acceptor oxidoreductase delta subunit (pyruvate/2-ketoisovalerate family)
VAEPRPITDLAHGVPPVAVSSTSTRVNKTGSWKYIRPVYRDRVAPCNQGCPVGIDIEGYMNLVREGRVEAARDLLLRENPMPATTGRVCYHPCELACNRASFDQSVAIHAVERMLGDLALDLPPSTPAKRRDETVGVIGAGPAGLACAYHLARLGYGVTVYEAESEPGGVLRWGIPEYRLEKTVLAKEVERVRRLGVEFRCSTRVGTDVPFETLSVHDAVFVATGVHRSRPLDVPGENLRGVLRGLDLLRRVNAGERPNLGKRVAVIGGGNTAMDCARTAVRLGAEVTVLYRRGRAEMPANAEEVEAALHEGVRFGFLAAPVEILGDARVPDEEPLPAIADTFGSFESLDARASVRGMRCVRMKLGSPDASGRRRPEVVPGSEFAIECDSVVTALGEEADLEFLPDEMRDRGGALHVSPLGGTSRTAVFAGGDIIEEPHTVAFAIGSGKRAAIGIDHYLRLLAGEDSDTVELGELRYGPDGNVSMTRWREDDPLLRVNPANEVAGFDAINPEHFTHVARHTDRLRPSWESRHDFAETNLGLTREDALAEARRCFNCGVCNGCEVCLVFCPDVAITRRDDGRFDIAYDYCKGCGICAAECPRGSVVMTREGL